MGLKIRGTIKNQDTEFVRQKRKRRLFHLWTRLRLKQEALGEVQSEDDSSEGTSPLEWGGRGYVR